MTEHEERWQEIEGCLNSIVLAIRCRYTKHNARSVLYLLSSIGRYIHHIQEHVQVMVESQPESLEIKILEWLEGRQLSQSERDRLRTVRVPEHSLGRLDGIEIPDELLYLRAIADRLYNMSVYDDEPETNRRVALWMIEHVERDLVSAREAIAVAEAG